MLIQSQHAKNGCINAFVEPSKTQQFPLRLELTKHNRKRQVKDVDFGLTFAPVTTLAYPPPSLPVPTRRSPRRSLEQAHHPSTRSTPVSRARSQPPISTPTDESIPPVVNPSGADTNTSAKYANISAKRRKLGTDESSTSMRSTQSSLPAPRRDVYTIGEEEQPRTDAAGIINGSVEQPTRLQPRVERDTSAFFVPQTAARSPTPALGEEEITESPTHAPGSGQRTRTMNQALIQSSRLQDELQVDNAAQAGDAGSPTPKRKRKRPTSNVPSTAQSHRTRRTSISEISNNDHAPVDEIDELSPDQPKRGRRRRSSIHRESLANTAREESVDERESAEEIDDAEAATILKKNRGRRISRRAPAEPSPDLDEPSALVLPVPRTQRSRTQQTSSPAKQQQPKNANQKVNPSKKQAKKQIRSGSPIPVTVHRLTNGLTYNDDEADADILNSDIPHSKRGGVNVIDVLNKLCTEIIESALETLRDSLRNTQEPGLKREYRNKHKVVEAFGREFNNRLVEHVSTSLRFP
jgi:hypothetical protein